MAKKTEQRQTYHLAYISSPEEMDMFTGTANGRLTATVNICPKPLPADSRLVAEKLMVDKKPAELLKLAGVDDPQLVTTTHYVFVVTLPARKLSCTVLRPVEKIVRFIEAEQIEATLRTGFVEASDKEEQPVSSTSSSPASLAVPLSEAHPTHETTPTSEESNSLIEEKTLAKPEEEAREAVPDIPGVI